MTELTMTATPTPAPVPSANSTSSREDKPQSSNSQEQEQRQEKPTANCLSSKPKVRLHAEDLRHPASTAFLALIPDVASTLDTALSNIVRYLYTPPRCEPPSASKAQKHNQPYFTPSIPTTRSVTFFLRGFGGVAYTTGTELDDDHKEIHLSLPYIQHCISGPTAKADPKHELVGVLTHELVHCYQHTAPPRLENDNGKRGSPCPPGGLIEGIADFVRLKAGLEPPHWKRPQSVEERASKWDAGYQHTAYFLAWIEDVRIGTGAIGMLNDRLLRVGYVGEQEMDCPGAGFWMGLFGVGVAELWDEYGLYLDGLKKDGEGSRGNWEEEIVHPEE